MQKHFFTHLNFPIFGLFCHAFCDSALMIFTTRHLSCDRFLLTVARGRTHTGKLFSPRPEFHWTLQMSFRLLYIEGYESFFHKIAQRAKTNGWGLHISKEKCRQVIRPHSDGRSAAIFFSTCVSMSR